MIGGYMGKLLFVDLTDKSFEIQDLSEEMARQFIGGYGIGARVLYNMLKPGVDPLSSDNIIGFLPGPLTGSPAFFSGRYTVVCKSPVTGGWNDSNSGGYFGPELKKAGFDGVFIKGASKNPVYLWINDGNVEIRDALGLWGKNVVETEKIIKDELNEKKLRVAAIGPAGEKLSLLAAVMNDDHRAAGRGGPGAVMGSKNLKAIAVRGTLKVPVADPEYLKVVNKEIADIIKNGENAQLIGAFSMFGTGLFNASSAIGGDTPVKNWSGAGLVDYDELASKKIDVMEIDPKFNKKKYSCANCPIGCGAEYLSVDGEFAVGETSRPEYETYGAFGAMLLNTNAEAIIKCNYICNVMGLDTISAGSTIAWAMECYEKGILTKEETGGLELTWGNAGAIVEALQVMADQSTQFGKLLALGSEGAAKKLGKGFDCLVTINGIELPMHDPRLCRGFARTYFVDPTPGRHVKGGLGILQLLTQNNEGTGEQDFIATTEAELINTSGLCHFAEVLFIKNITDKLIKAVVGWDYGQEELVQTGTRIFNMRHAFNLREGFDPLKITVPTTRYVGEPPMEKGPTTGVTVDIKALTRDFIEKIDWDQRTWIPSRQSLGKLGGMDDVIKDLYES